jgi:hypothetical protein
MRRIVNGDLTHLTGNVWSDAFPRTPGSVYNPRLVPLPAARTRVCALPLLNLWLASKLNVLQKEDHPH